MAVRQFVSRHFSQVFTAVGSSPPVNSLNTESADTAAYDALVEQVQGEFKGLICGRIADVFPGPTWIFRLYKRGASNLCPGTSGAGESSPCADA